MALTSRLTTQPEPETPSNRAIFSMSWPMAMRDAMMFSITIIEIYLVSSLGEQAVASIGIASVISGTVMGTTFAFANAMQIKVAQTYGTKKSLNSRLHFLAAC